MFFSKYEWVLIRDFNDLTVQTIFDACWASTNVGPKYPNAWNYPRHASSWRFLYHCGIEKTGSPGIICIICHQVLRHPSKHGTSWMGKHLLAEPHIAKLNEITKPEIAELTIAKVDETALAILKKQGSRGNTILSSQRKFIIVIPLNPYWSNWQTECSKLAAKDYETSQFHQDTWNHYLILDFVAAHIPCNSVSHLDLRQSFEVLRSDLGLSSATTPSNSCWRDYALTVDAIKKQLPSPNNDSSTMDGWTSTNTINIMLVIAYYLERNWALWEVQLTSDEVDRLFFSSFES